MWSVAAFIDKGYEETGSIVSAMDNGTGCAAGAIFSTCLCATYCTYGLSTDVYVATNATSTLSASSIVPRGAATATHCSSSRT